MWKKTFALLALAALLAASSAAAPPDHARAWGHARQELRALFAEAAEEGGFNGSVLVAREGHVLLAEGYGIADATTGERNRPDTVFNIASLTKAFTAAAVLMLRDGGLLSLEDAAADYVPEILAVPGAESITLRQLLSHTSGLFDFPNNPALWPNFGLYHTPEEMLEYFIHEPLLFAPGERFEYSNSNYIVAGLIIERVSGLSFEDFLRLFFLEPLGLRDTLYDPYDETVFRRRAVGYDDLAADPPAVAFYIYPSITYAVGGMVSTVEEMFVWDQALYGDALLSAASREEMFTPGLGGYALGWYADEMVLGGAARRHVWHWGSYPGYHGYFSRLVDDRVTVVLLLNLTQPDDDPDHLRPLVERAAALALGID